MAKKWAEVQASPGYQALEPAAREEARQQYFREVVTPQLPPEQVDAARKQFDTETAAPAAPEDKSWHLMDKAKKLLVGAGKTYRDNIEAGLHMGSGMVGQLVGDVASLGVLPTAAAADLFTGGPGTSGIDPAAIRDKIASSMTYEPTNPDSIANQGLQLPGKLIAKAGDKLAEGTGADQIPYLDNAVRQIPNIALTVLGAKAPKAPKLATAIEEAPKNMTPEQLHRTAVNTLLKDDVRLTTEQRGTGLANKQAGSIGRAADTILGKSRLAKEQLQDFTRAVLKKVGVEAKNVTPDAMAEVKGNVTAAYEKAHADVHVGVDKELAQDLSDIGVRAKRNPAVENKFDAMLEHIKASSEATPQGVRISAKNAEEIRHELGNIENSADSNIKSVAREIKDALDTAAERSSTPEQAAALKDARTKHHFMRQIEGAIDSTNGTISPKKLLKTIESKRNKNEAVFGKGNQELVTLARAGAKVLPEEVGNSGTASRTMDVVKGVVALGHPVTAAKAVGATFGGRFLNEARATRGTTSQIAKDQAAAARGPALGRVAATTLPKETQEQKKRRLQAEALKGSN